MRPFILYPERTTTIQVFYYRPDFHSIIQEFVWQTDDVPPQFPRTKRFLDHWHRNIDAVIQQILLSYAGRSGHINRVDAIFLLDS